MKTNFFISLAFLILMGTVAQAQKIEIHRLELAKKQVYNLRKGDSSASLIIDTLIMHSGSKIKAFGKKTVIIKAAWASVDSKCSISGDDGRNNGTNFDLRMNFSKLNGLIINSQGKNFTSGNRNYPMGHGGNVSIHYLNSGIKPQTMDKSLPGYLMIFTGGGTGSVNPNVDLEIIRSQIRSGSVPGRPLSGLTNGVVFQGSDGNAGKVSMQSVETL